MCGACGCVQKAIDAGWLAEVDRIYGDYSIYFQSDGVEQSVFDSDSGQGSLRSTRLLEALAARFELAAEGRMLDLGCGSGAMLRAFSRFAPGWRLAGSELSDTTRSAVESIERVEALYVGEPEQIPGSFDILTMSHLLEHIPRPKEYLARLLDKLNPGGLLVIEVPNYLQNPFDLLVADHSTHFTIRTAAEVIRRAGYRVMAAETDWVPKELSIVALKPTSEVEKTRAEGASDSFNVATRMVGWLKQTAGWARECARKGRFGIFGTSIAATWLCAEVGDAVSFFVDEDPSRIGREFMGRDVYHPSEVPGGSHVFIGLPTIMAEALAHRLAKSDVEFYLPPRFTGEPG